MGNPGTHRHQSRDQGPDLLPRPKEVALHDGVCVVSRETLLELQTEDPRIKRAAARWLSCFGGAHGNRHEAGACPMVRIAVDATQAPHRDGYRLHVRKDGIELAGASPAGGFYGLQTLAQLQALDWGSGVGIPPKAAATRRPTDLAESPHAGNVCTVRCCTITDWPDFATRGLLHDITRGKVPTLETLKQLVDRLAFLKINQIQLYMEHAFVFSFDPDICGPVDGLTPDEIHELDVYCRQRFIELVPALATFGHMGRVLSMPRYRHLAEIEASKSWSEMSWPERMRGQTLDCMNPESQRLVDRMWSDILEAFSAPVVNICGDEPWDLGQGKNRGRLDNARKGEAYVAQLCRTHDFCARRGRKTQFWSDVLRNYPHLLHRLPADSTLLHWGYDDESDYEATATFVAAGLPTFVCPGTSGWKRILNAVELAERNIHTFAMAGRDHGATGLVNTDWGDQGHFNLLACSWHGIALGAAAGWTADHPVGNDFDACAGPLIFGTMDLAGPRLLRKVSRIGERCETWRLLWMPLHAVSTDTTLPSSEAVHEAREHSAAFLRWLGQTQATAGGDTRDLAELSVAAQFMDLFTEKIRLVHAVSGGTGDALSHRDACRDLAERMDQSAGAYSACWLARNKETGLDDIRRALSAIAEDLRDHG